jgi:hypothetical protein
VSTDTDGAALSVRAGPSVDRGTAGRDADAGEADDSDADSATGPDTGALWLHEEIRRRMAANGPSSGGRHARPDSAEPPPATGHVPRHSERTPGPGAPRPGPVGGPSLPTGGPYPGRRQHRARPTARSGLPGTGSPRAMPPGNPAGSEYAPVAGGPAREPVAPPAVPEQRGAEAAAVATGEPAPDTPPKRVRVELSRRRPPARPVRIIKEVQENTAVGELLRSELIGSQLTVALRFAAFAGIALGVLPLLFAMFPVIGQTEVLGLRLPWLLLGVLVYPFLLGLGWWHTRTAERVEQNFADHIQD